MTSSATPSWVVVIHGVSLRSRRLYCDWSGRYGNQPGKSFPTRPKNWRSDGTPITACATESAINSASEIFPAGPLRGITNESANT